jgi:WXG100 family type VII secretion target
MSRFEVDSAQVAKAGAAVQASATAISAEVDGMMRHLVELQASWKGPAATSFQLVVADWRTTQGRVHDTLDEIRRALSVAGEQYAEAENTAARMITR